MRSIKTILFAGLVLVNSSLFAQENTGNQVIIKATDKHEDIIRKAANVKPSTRQLRWQQLELTAFFHFGVNTFTNREWGDGKEDPKIFNPTKLDARQWVRTMKEAGFKQVILTAKHHDGFCLWPSKFTEHSVKNSPWKGGKGDVVKEVAAACKEYKIGFGVYLSPWDRNHKDYGDSKIYNEYFVNQLTELLSNYGKVDEVWFDGANGTGPNGKKPVYDFANWYKLIRKLQPSATIAVMGPDVRWVGTESGYGRETEWSVLPADENMLKAIADNSQKEVAFVPAGDKMGEDLGSRSKILNAKGLVWYPAETDVSIRDGWFYHPEQDNKVKTPEKLMDIYFSSVGRNSVLLLNVPPDKNGLVSESDVKTLKDWSFLRNELFAENIAKQASLKASNGNNVNSILDGSQHTYYVASPKDTAATINLTFSKPVEFDVLSLQENIAIGQRVEKFVLEYKDGDDWKTITQGTTIGYKRLLRFKAIVAKEVRLNILSSRLNPTITELGLYKSK
ncbi:alpha-L-fucosidase [Pedobacter frigiditerrae]|uniref:alpha-L-fucosidase n=1 Tax=Pedobacter frigiditerrae TaxID=2530452 RepID=A0A4R0MXK2_9SPHI|nr:alpha-L-fucosidase [Pedobacter frigiditerrae]TCC91607.1 alpha-L-fucosidase [Pedobacter frigiditerrae]